MIVGTRQILVVSAAGAEQDSLELNKKRLIAACSSYLKVADLYQTTIVGILPVWSIQLCVKHNANN